MKTTTTETFHCVCCSSDVTADLWSTEYDSCESCADDVRDMIAREESRSPYYETAYSPDRGQSDAAW